MARLDCRSSRAGDEYWKYKHNRLSIQLDSLRVDCFFNDGSLTHPSPIGSNATFTAKLDSQPDTGYPEATIRNLQ
jgi:hypothetical protein